MQQSDSGPAARYRRIADGFTRRAKAVAPDAWGNPAPCAGWVARDIVRHLVEWFPPFLEGGAGLALSAGPSVDTDPLGAWITLDKGVRGVFDAPDITTRRFEHDRAGSHALGDAIDMFFTGDVLIHTWDLARATGGDETLDPDEVHRMLVGLEPLDEMLRGSGQYGPRVAVPDDADEQTRLIAFVGRQP